jgi:hypothetical protein
MPLPVAIARYAIEDKQVTKKVFRYKNRLLAQ